MPGCPPFVVCFGSARLAADERAAQFIALAGGVPADFRLLLQPHAGHAQQAIDKHPRRLQRHQRAGAAMRPIAKAHATSVARVALAWVLAKPFVTSVIIGARNEAQLDDNLEAVKLSLGADEIAGLDKLSAQREEYPHWMISRFASQRLPQPK